MGSDGRWHKWQQHYRQTDVALPQAAGVLLENSFLLPTSGRALDLACGLGGNAIFLARQGFDTEAWDYAPAAVESVQQTAQKEGLPLTGVVRDVEQDAPAAASFDVIAVSYFLARGVIPSLIEALRPGGLMFYETFVKQAVGDEGPRNPAFRLDDNELLRLFSSLRVLSYQEHGRVGDPTRGQRNVARLVAQKRTSG